jgi:hypothetical protein
MEHWWLVDQLACKLEQRLGKEKALPLGKELEKVKVEWLGFELVVEKVYGLVQTLD